MNFEKAKTMSICFKTTHIFKILLSPTNEYEKNTAKFKFHRFLNFRKQMLKIFQHS